MRKNMYAVASTLIKDMPNKMNIMTDLRLIEAVSKEEAIGIYMLQVSEQYSEHQIHIRPAVMPLPEPPEN